MYTIIWIEDDIDIIYPVVYPLEKDGHSIITFRSVDKALEAIDQLRRADLILLDMFLPSGETGQDISKYEGLELLRDMRQRYHINTPVVVFTVVAQDYLVAELKKLDVADIIRKPVLPSELKGRIERALSRDKF